MVYISRQKKTLSTGEKVTYLYLAHNVRKNGVTVKEWTISLGKEEIAEKKLKKIAENQKGLFPEEAEHLSSALICTYYEIFKRFNFIEIVNKYANKNRAQGLTPGHYLLFIILNRLVDPKSKRQLKEWFDGTILVELFPDASKYLTSQDIWNNLQYFNEKNQKEIFLDLLISVQKVYGGTEQTFLLDATNFYTYIGEHPENTLPKRGHSKENRKNLKQINFTLVIDQKKEYPIYYKTFPGNVQDVTHFTEILGELKDWFNKLDPNQPSPKHTIIFDKGNNSAEAMQIINKNNWDFIGSLRPSMFKELLHEPFTEFSKIYDTQKKHPVYAFRREDRVYTGKKRVIIVTFDEKVCNKRLRTLDYHITKRFDKLREFEIHKLNTKPQWQNPEKIQKHIDTQILKQKDFKNIITIILEGIVKNAISYQKLRWGHNCTHYDEKIETFGKSIIFSSKLDWSTKDIILGYRSQFKVEHKFRDMKSTDYIKTRPIFHWKDNTIRTHLFSCMLAVMGQSLLKLRFKEEKIKGSFLELTRNLQKIHKINLISSKKGKKHAILPQLSKKQNEIFKKLNLTLYFN